MADTLETTLYYNRLRKDTRTDLWVKSAEATLVKGLTQIPLKLKGPSSTNATFNLCHLPLLLTLTAIIDSLNTNRHAVSPGDTVNSRKPQTEDGLQGLMNYTGVKWSYAHACGTRTTEKKTGIKCSHGFSTWIVCLPWHDEWREMLGRTNVLTELDDQRQDSRKMDALPSLQLKIWNHKTLQK